MTFTQSFTSIEYNVTAVEQTDTSYGTGPAYLLNGLSDTGYWYQVGLSWNWNPGYTPGTGFDMVYEVFAPDGNSIFPTNGGAGLISFTVNQGDGVLLNLYFTNTSQVAMLAEDQNTGANANEAYSAEGATYFAGSLGSVASSQGFFTGLMTEWYHASAYYENEQSVTYSNPGFALSSAWMWIDEFEVVNDNTKQSIFFGSTTSPVSYSSNPSQLQEFSSNGATEYSNAYEFVTGSLSVVSMTLSYSIQGGGSGYISPTVTYISNGVQQTATLSTSPTTYFVDTNTTWSVTNPLTGSSLNERWQTDQQTTGIATSQQTTNFVYYHQYQIGFGYQVAGSTAGAGYSPPQITYYQFDAQQTTAPENQAWVDVGSNYSYQNPLQGSASSERWYSPSPSGIVSSPEPIATSYFHQYAVTINYSIIGSSGNLIPTIVSTSFGLPSTLSLPTSTEVLWLDAGSAYALGNPVMSGTTERLSTQGVTSGTVSPGLILSPTYYDQYLVAWSYSVSGGGSGYSAPGLIYTSSGTNMTTPLVTTADSYWADSDSAWILSNPLSGSTSIERWDTNSSTAGNITSSGTYLFTYYHQYLIAFEYSLIGSGSGYSPPAVNFTEFGDSRSVIANASDWVDNGAAYSYPETLGNSTSSERWIAASAISGSITASVAPVVLYQHQYYITTQPSTLNGGTVSPSSGWYNATQTISLVPSTSAGWKFESWSGDGAGSYSGNANLTTITVNASVNETAVFYAGVAINVKGGGSVSYSYGTASGTIGGEAAKTVYLPVGTSISLSTNPSLFIYSFKGWSGALSSESTTVALIVNSPESIQANYGYNYMTIEAIVGSVVGVVALVALYSTRRRKIAHAKNVPDLGHQDFT
jgi:hypothetical protein